MRYGVDVSYSLKQWKNAINNKFRENNRYLDDDMESEFWHNYFKKDIPINNDYAKEIIRDLKLILAGYNLKNGLELGPGWGNYTYFLADNLEELEIVDISSDSLEFIKSRAEEKSIENIKYHNSSFKNFDFKEYDLIFGFNCFYRELDIEKLLLNTNNSARKLAILGLMTSYEPEFNYEIKSKFNYELDGMTNDYILLTNILYSLGIDVNQKIIPIKRKYKFKNLEKIKNHEMFRIREPYNNSNVDSILLKYFNKEENGYSIEVEAKAAIIYWNPSKINEI